MAENKKNPKEKDKNSESLMKNLKAEWARIKKPENVLKDTVKILIVTVIGAAVTGGIDTVMNLLVGLIGSIV